MPGMGTQGMNMGMMPAGPGMGMNGMGMQGMGMNGMNGMGMMGGMGGNAWRQLVSRSIVHQFNRCNVEQAQVKYLDQAMSQADWFRATITNCLS